jgi:hypothetical protein
MRWREHRRDGFALCAVFRLIHRDEHRTAEFRRRIANGNAAETRFRRIDLMIGLDMHDVVVLHHRPVRTELAVLAVVNRILFPQPLKIGPERIGAEKIGIAGIEVLKRRRIGLVARRLLLGALRKIQRAVHRASP